MTEQVHAPNMMGWDGIPGHCKMCRINSARNLLLSKMMKFFVVTFWVAARVYCSSDESSFY